jgi:hypothetical protein
MHVPFLLGRLQMRSLCDTLPLTTGAVVGRLGIGKRCVFWCLGRADLRDNFVLLRHWAEDVCIHWSKGEMKCNFSLSGLETRDSSINVAGRGAFII